MAHGHVVVKRVGQTDETRNIRFVFTSQKEWSDFRFWLGNREQRERFEIVDSFWGYQTFTAEKAKKHCETWLTK